ncbi:hypothetical protein N7U66_17880 [Lacinutrix neustonica]|uniref:Uncharacterized protein n=1 Tax=Lacinutrix neustonica TaxID=2980107 RepID=A0A9E8SDZ1_9FLAO|nr:hypothetical protein [Lacinutrix neustonica]WAC01744.1 hypothetical protein N7U66_17880 [Lacinutrix neustonica]
MKSFSQIFIATFAIFTISTTHAQIGINTSSPDPSSILDIASSDKGVLLPRMTTSEIALIPNPANGLLIFNTDTNNFIYNIGSTTTPVWSSINKDATVSTDANNQITTGTDGGAFLDRSLHMGKFIISSTGTTTISGLPFQPSQIKFTGYANVETYNLNADNGVGNNNTGIANAFGSMSRFCYQLWWYHRPTDDLRGWVSEIQSMIFLDTRQTVTVLVYVILIKMATI